MLGGGAVFAAGQPLLQQWCYCRRQSERCVVSSSCVCDFRLLQRRGGGGGGRGGGGGEGGRRGGGGGGGGGGG